MENSESLMPAESTANRPAETVAPSESATVVTSDGSHVPRYGATPYGGGLTVDKTLQNNKEH